MGQSKPLSKQQQQQPTNGRTQALLESLRRDEKPIHGSGLSRYRASALPPLMVLDSPKFSQFRWARTLSGEEEGAFAWISLNYRQGLFDEDESSTRPGSPADIGVVETGGASTQVSPFSPPT